MSSYQRRSPRRPRAGLAYIIRRGPDRHTERASTACDHCREKKLRCHNFRPKCTRCNDRGLKCRYSRRDLRRASVTGDEGRSSESNMSSDTNIRQAIPRSSVGSSVSDRMRTTRTSPFQMKNFDSSHRTILPGNYVSDSATSGRYISTPGMRALPASSLMSLSSESQGLASRTSSFDWSPIHLNSTRQQREPLQSQNTSEECLDPSLLVVSGARSTSIKGGLIDLPTFELTSQYGTAPIQVLSDAADYSTPSASRSRADSSNMLTATIMPHPRILFALIPIFLQRFGDQFPFLNSEQLMHRVNDRASYPLIIAICALAVRSTETQSVKDPALRRAIDIATVHANETMDNVYLNIDVMQANAKDDTVSTFLFFALHQMSVGVSNRFLVLLNASVESVQEIARRSIDHIAENTYRSALYWNIYAMHQMVSFSRNQKSSFFIRDSIPIPNILLDQGQQSTFSHFVQLMKIIAGLSECLYGEGTEIATFKRLERLQMDLTEWQFNLPIPLRQATAARSVLRQEPCLYLQMYLWFYCSLTLVQQELSSLQPQTQASMTGTDPVEEWANQKTAEFVVLYRSIRPQMLVSCPFVYYPLCVALEQSRCIAAKKAASLDRQSASARILLAQSDSNVSLFAEAVEELEQYWPGIGNLLDQS